MIDRMMGGTSSQNDRYDMINYAVDKITLAGGLAYIDAGDSNWIPWTEMATRLEKAGVRRARGFSLNISHYEFSKNENIFAKNIRSKFPDLDLRYVVDCSRNGKGANGLGGELEWCNAPGSGIGNRPTFKTPSTTRPGFDARLWVKGWSSDGDRKLVEADGVLYKPGEKAPTAGSPYPGWAMELYRLAKPALPSLT
jgi:endoglucanase